MQFLQKNTLYNSIDETKVFLPLFILLLLLLSVPKEQWKTLSLLYLWMNTDAQIHENNFYQNLASNEICLREKKPPLSTSQYERAQYIKQRAFNEPSDHTLCDNMFDKLDGSLMALDELLVTLSTCRWVYRVNMMVEGKEEKKLFWGAIKIFSIQVIKKLSCKATQLAHCQYLSCSEMGFSQ